VGEVHWGSVQLSTHIFLRIKFQTNFVKGEFVENDLTERSQGAAKKMMGLDFGL
jgi:hypothetical protein